MILEGCQGKPQVSIMEKTCPKCGHEIEIFSVDTQAVCEHCGFVIYNDTLTCVQWCNYARECFGDEAYENLMRAAQIQKERAEAAKWQSVPGSRSMRLRTKGRKS